MPSMKAMTGPDDFLTKPTSWFCPFTTTGGLCPAFTNVTMPVSRSKTPTHAVRNMFAGLFAHSSALALVIAAAGSRMTTSLSFMSVLAVIM